MAHAPSPEKASPFGEIKLIELDWASEWVHPVLPLLQRRYLFLALPLSRATICRVGREQCHGWDLTGEAVGGTVRCSIISYLGLSSAWQEHSSGCSPPLLCHGL